jgi:uncharacterized RmlC-like cupin family protein
MVPAMSEEPSVVRSTQRRSATGLPVGVAGEQAFHLEGAWVGFLRLEPGASSPWHHHGQWDSYAYVTEGVLRWEFGLDGRDSVTIAAGDVGRMPARVVHRDVSAGAEDLAMVLFRTGEGQLTIDVDGPDAVTEERSA